MGEMSGRHPIGAAVRPCRLRLAILTARGLLEHGRGVVAWPAPVRPCYGPACWSGVARLTLTGVFAPPGAVMRKNGRPRNFWQVLAGGL